MEALHTAMTCVSEGAQDVWQRAYNNKPDIRRHMCDSLLSSLLVLFMSVLSQLGCSQAQAEAFGALRQDAEPALTQVWRVNDLHQTLLALALAQ